MFITYEMDTDEEALLLLILLIIKKKTLKNNLTHYKIFITFFLLTFINVFV